MTEGDGGRADDRAPLRIGTAERTAAMTALDEHLAAGRLGVEEYADRSAVAANATVAAELAALFTDLPAPHPALAGPAPVQAAAVSPAVRATRSAQFLNTWGGRVVAVTPFVALALFFLTGHWWFFLLIPAVPALIYGSGHGDDDRERHRRRDRRH